MERKDRSVALTYSQGKDEAPKVAARGQGPMSDLIRRLADDYGIPIHNDPILAEALYHFPEDEPIPPELYVAVAEVYAFLIRTRRIVLGEKTSSL